jgi:tartrate dehydratase alpha subunit/fumarate hydratase class I-like protein
MKSEEIYSKVVNFPKDMKEDIEKASKSETRTVTSYIVNTIKRDIEDKKEKGAIK